MRRKKPGRPKGSKNIVKKRKKTLNTSKETNNVFIVLTHMLVEISNKIDRLSSIIACSHDLKTSIEQITEEKKDDKCQQNQE